MLKLVFYKTLTFWRPWLNSNAYSLKLVVASLLINGTKYLLCLIGLLKLLRSPSTTERRAAVFILFFFAASTAPHMMTHSMMRFRLPYAEPIIDLIAGTVFASFVISRIQAYFIRNSVSDSHRSRACA